MASFRKRGKTWTAEVRKGGVVEYATFPTKAEAQEWAAELERKIRQGKHTIAHNRTLGDLLERYAAEVTPKKRGKEWELRRITWLLSQALATTPLASLSPAQFAQWRDARLATASGETVRRDFNLLSHALNIAIREWGWLTENPLAKVSRPQGNPPRKRVASDEEIERICHAAGYVIGTPPETATARVAACAVFAVETGMRSGEILGISRVDCAGGNEGASRFVRLAQTKNGTARDVPLSETARQVLRDVGGSFGLTASQRDALWRKIRGRAGIEGLRFHDLRATAVTRLSKRLDPLALARMIGHKNIDELLTYYRESAEEIAKRLD